MIDLEEMRTSVASGLKKHLGVQVIRADQIAKAPKHPYVTYNVTTTASKNNGTWQQHDDGIDRKLVRSTWSITVVAADWDESVRLATKARAWFEHTGHTWLSDRGITVQSTTDINNRDNLLSVDYERKNGFDVFFYVYDEEGSPTTETIEGVEIAHEILK